MPKNRLQETVFTIMMVLVMVYAMICYNIALETGDMKNFVFKGRIRRISYHDCCRFYSRYVHCRTTCQNVLSKSSHREKTDLLL